MEIFIWEILGGLSGEVLIFVWCKRMMFRDKVFSWFWNRYISFFSGELFKFLLGIRGVYFREK